VSTATLGKHVDFAAPAVAPLTLTDRCDAAAVAGAPNGRTGRGPCGAQGFIRAVLPSGNDLVFCAHHGREQEAALAAGGCDHPRRHWHDRCLRSLVGQVGPVRRPGHPHR
jgi:hypothetical protein